MCFDNYNFVFLTHLLTQEHALDYLKPLDLILFILIKVLIDQVSLGLYFIRLRRIKEYLFLPFYSIIYPFYGVLILINAMQLKQEWKGRKVINFK